MKNDFVPLTFQVPESIRFPKYQLEVLTPALAELDYDAVVSSKARLRSVFGEHTTWPEEDLSLERNIEDLKWHEQEFRSRSSFSYSVLALGGDRCLGCVYVYPSKAPGYDSEVYLWVRDDCLNLDEDLHGNVREWLKQSWPFQNVAYPGRDLDWGKWKELNRKPE